MQRQISIRLNENETQSNSKKSAECSLRRASGKLSQLTVDVLYQPACFVDESTTAQGPLA